MFERFFGKKEPEQNKDYGFQACATCTTGHTPGCTKIDAQLADMYELKPTDPRYGEKLAYLKQELKL